MSAPRDDREFEAQWRARFERFAQTFDDEPRISGWSDAGLRRRVAAFSALVPGMGLPERARALELGCGGGTYVRLLAGLGHRTVGLDYSVPSLQRALAADPGRKGVYLAGEAYDLPFPAATFDLVVSIGVLQALSDPGRAIAEMSRVLRPGGAVVVEALNGLGLVELVRRGLARLRGWPTRVRTYPPADVHRWLAAAGLMLVSQPALRLPPRQTPWMESVLESRPVRAMLDAVPPLGNAAAHSFLFVARHAATAGGRR
ncbi:MAG TPA: methyltransferase domain-containing protein [Methylomirabilota bacterium]|nr:methyltransferase domain-containing protein [Methylomirabilota bacterium]